MIAKFLSLFLSYVILLTSLPITNNAYAAITKEQCEDMPGKQWNERTGRCVEAQDITRLSGDAMACADSADPNCYTGNAIEQIGESDAPDSRGGSRNNLGRSQIRQVLPMAMSLFTTLYMLKNRSTGTENPKWKNARTISLSLILASGYAIAIGEISAHITYKMKLKKLVKNYKRDLETNVDDDTTDTDTVTTSTSEEDENGLSLIERRQKEAYTFLAKQEDLRKKAANIRRAFYITATAMYTAASIAAIMETIQENTTGANNTETPAGGGGASSSGSSPTSFLYTPKQDSRFVNLQKNFIDYSLEKMIFLVVNVLS